MCTKIFLTDFDSQRPLQINNRTPSISTAGREARSRCLFALRVRWNHEEVLDSS